MDQDERDAVSRAQAAISAALDLLPATTPEPAMELFGAALLTLRALLGDVRDVSERDVNEICILRE